MATEIKYRIFPEPQDYGEMLLLQERTRNEIIEGKNGGTIYFLEHDPVYTSGLRGTDDQFIRPLNGIPVHKIKRGGELTWHGPGQLVLYPVVDIRKAGFLSIREFVNFFGLTIESVLREYCGISKAVWIEEKAGVWVDDRKIAFSGLHFRKFVSVHGYSLNIDPDLKSFSSIVPCGMPDCKITSIKNETGKDYSMESISRQILLKTGKRITGLTVF